MPGIVFEYVDPGVEDFDFVFVELKLQKGYETHYSIKAKYDNVLLIDMLIFHVCFMFLSCYVGPGCQG